MSVTSEVCAVIRERLDPTVQDLPKQYMKLPYGFRMGTLAGAHLVMVNDRDPNTKVIVGVIMHGPYRWVMRLDFRESVREMVERLGLEQPTEEVPF